MPPLLRAPTLTLGQSTDSLGSEECTPKRLAFTPPGSLTPMMASPVQPLRDSQLAHQHTGFSEATTPATLLYSPPSNTQLPAANTHGQPSAPATATTPATNAALVHGQPLANLQSAMHLQAPAHSTPASTHGQPPQMTPPTPAMATTPATHAAASGHGHAPANTQPAMPPQAPAHSTLATTHGQPPQCPGTTGTPASSNSSGVDGCPDGSTTEVSIQMEGTMYTDGTYWKKPACIKAATCSTIWKSHIIYIQCGPPLL